MAPRGSQDRQPSGVQALAGTGQKHPWELVHGGRGRAGESELIPTHSRLWGQADPGSEREKCPQEVPEWEKLLPSNILRKYKRVKHLCIGSCMGA